MDKPAEQTHPMDIHLNTCVTPEGSFRSGVHSPAYRVTNLRETESPAVLGSLDQGGEHRNHANFPDGDVQVDQADRIYEIPNPFPFRGATYITRSWAEAKAAAPESIRLPAPPRVSMSELLKEWHSAESGRQGRELLKELPQPVLLALAANSTDPADLVELAQLSCAILYDTEGVPQGMEYTEDSRGRLRAKIHNHYLFEIVVNNPWLPDAYKEVMVLRPGAQGTSEIVGQWQKEESHVFEYLRANSYIPWGHYAANMANDQIRYRVGELSQTDMDGLRHLYYQRTYVRLAAELDLPLPEPRKRLNRHNLEELRQTIVKALAGREEDLFLDRTLWGWNFGFDCAASQYRLHASHQMIHQQFAMLPAALAPETENSHSFHPYGCGDLVEDLVVRYRQRHNSDFFNDYLRAIHTNQRLDGRSDRPASLVVFEDEQVILFVPKAQTSQWELQLMTKREVGNILEADTATRASLNRGMLTAMQVLTGLGARMISTIEFPKRLTSPESSQRLVYSFLPKLPESMGAFSEAQLRWINGHYPEDFALACRVHL